MSRLKLPKPVKRLLLSYTVAIGLAIIIIAGLSMQLGIAVPSLMVSIGFYGWLSFVLIRAVIRRWRKKSTA